MFRWLFLYWYNNTDVPSITAKVNLWSYINIRFFKVKVSASIVYYINSIKHINFREIKAFYKNISFEFFYIKFFLGIIYFILFFFLLSVVY